MRPRPGSDPGHGGSGHLGPRTGAPATTAAPAIIGAVVVQNTSRYPTDEVQRLVRFATRDLDMRRVCVNIKNSHRYAYGGYAYLGVPEISNAPASSEYLITLRLGAPDRFPCTPPRRRGSPPLHLGCWREALVAVAAHEGWHIQQYRQELPRSEVACERFEAVIIERFRATETGSRRLSDAVA